MNTPLNTPPFRLTFPHPKNTYALEDFYPLEYGFFRSPEVFDYANLTTRYTILFLRSGKGTLTTNRIYSSNVTAPCGLMFYPNDSFTLSSDKASPLEFAFVSFCGRFAHLFSSVPRIFPASEYFSDEILTAYSHPSHQFLISSFIHKCCALSVPRELETKRLAELHVNAAIIFINHHFSSQINCRQIASHMKLGEKYLSRCFKSVTGMTLIQYIHRKKMTVALDYLKNGKSISYTATAVGYSDYSAFSRAFKSFWHYNPGEVVLLGANNQSKK